MPKVLIVTVAVVLKLPGCSSSGEPLAFDLAHPMEPPPAPFTVTGAAVDENVVCSAGVWVSDRMENMDGEEIDFEGWADMFDIAVATDGVAEAMSYKTFECDDGSGAISTSTHVRFDFAVFDIATFGQGQIADGTWTIEGTGEYDSLTGSGEGVTNFDEEQIHLIGEVRG